jgi:cyclopropane fatty-acyl-phospholipid synthase-like methyltransferase
MNRTAYNRISARWDEARSEFYGREQGYLERLLEGLPAHSTILDAGCGTGRPMAQYVLARGHGIIGVDQSEALLALARKRFPHARWIEAALESYAFDEPVHGVICWDTLFHIARMHHAGILERMARAIVVGGCIMLTAGGSEHPPFTDTMLGESFFYDSHPPEILLRMLYDLGFESLVSEFMNLPTGGRDKGRYAVVARKR